jgi:putative Mn2+ efflux pump MntP
VISPLFLSFAVAGFGVALVHVAIPTHWLPFVLVGRAQGWTLSRVMTAAAAAAVGHIATTSVVGVLILVAGRFMEQWIQGVLHYAAAALLLGFGLFYLARAFQRRVALAGLTDQTAVPPPRVDDRAAWWGVVGALALTPGEVLLSFYLTGDTHGWPGLVLLSGMFLAGTLAGMAALIAVTWAGMAHFRMDRLARYESAILGAVLVLLGVAVVVFQT